MVFKSLAVIIPGALATVWASGGFDDYPRTVDGSPEAVMASLADLDVREMPGSPGSTAESAGGIKPRFQLTKGENRLDWFVMSGSQVATRMSAIFEPVDGGTRTRITYDVERGDAPEQYTSPAFRSESLTAALFQTALDTEIDEMNTPGWGAHCDQLADKLMAHVAVDAVYTADIAEGGIADGDFALKDRSRPMTKEDQVAAIKGVAAGIGGLVRMRGKLLEQGCNPDVKDAQTRGPDGFRPVSNMMGEGGDTYRDTNPDLQSVDDLSAEPVWYDDHTDNSQWGDE